MLETILRIHDAWVVWFLQTIFYGYWPVSLAVCYLLLVWLPPHRLAAQIVAWTVIAWIVVCHVFYGMFSEATLLSLFLIGILLYRLLRWTLWLLPANAPGKKIPSWRGFWLPNSGWFTAIVRDYLRADPRAVYWLDLARSARGLTMERTPAQRGGFLLLTPGIPEWRFKLWKTIFRLVEARISLFLTLPGYWKRRHTQLGLDEPHLQMVLEQQAEVARQRMLQCWTGQSFEDYCSRDSRTHQRMRTDAGLFGRKFCLHREALAEYATARQPWRPQEKGLFQAALIRYECWRQRRQFDKLWLDRVASPSQSEEPSPVPTDADDERTEQSLSDLPLEFLPKQDELSDEELFDDPNADSRELPLFSDLKQDGDSEDEAVASPDDHQPDLIAASELLQSYLGLRRSGRFQKDIGRVETLLGGSKTQLAALMLLMLYCMRRDLQSEVDRALLIRLSDRFGQGSYSSKSDREVRRLFRSMLLDLLIDRGEYAQIRDLFGLRTELSRYEQKILADAKMAMAERLTDEEELRDMLRYEAIGHYFEAGFCGLWTQEYASHLVENVQTVDDLISLLRSHSVVIRTPGTLHLTQAQKRPARAREPLKIVISVFQAKDPEKKVRKTINALPYTIGAAKPSDLLVRGPGIAKTHLRLQLHKGQLAVGDLSKSGLRLNGGKRMSGSTVKEGDRIQFEGLIVQIEELSAAVLA